jgi:hypothetical protein
MNISRATLTAMRDGLSNSRATRTAFYLVLHRKQDYRDLVQILDQTGCEYSVMEGMARENDFEVADYFDLDDDFICQVNVAGALDQVRECIRLMEAIVGR